MSEQHSLPPSPNEPSLVTTQPAEAPTLLFNEGTHSDAPLLARIPGYELLGELGRGGMGVVYKARHCLLNRLVAVKMILSGGHAGDAELARFRAEGEAIARLQHPHIIQIHDVGEYQGMPFFTLEFCSGGTLQQKLNGAPLAPQAAASLIETLAWAIHIAHDQRIVHRDLKPANVLFTDDGVAKITDFGLAKQLDGNGQTQSGAIMGTPSYMAPEQADGRGKEVGPATDVYALGAILYECLVGRPPFKAATTLDTILQVINDEPVPPRQLQSKVPGDLETICLKCLRKQPSKRYGTAEALAQDLARFRNGEPITARRVNWLERGWRWCRRNPVVTGLTTAVFLSLLSGICVATWFAVQASDEAYEVGIQSQKVRIQAGQLRDEALNVRHHLYDAQMNRIQLTWEEDQPERIPDLLDAQLPEHTGGIDLRGFEWYFWSHRRRAELLCLTTRQGQAEYSTTNGLQAAIVASGLCTVWNATTGKQLSRFSMASPVDKLNAVAIALSPDGKILAAGGEFRANTRPTTAMKQSEFSIHLWDAASGAELAAFEGHAGRITSLAFSDDGRFLASTSRDGTARVWDLAASKQLYSLAWPTFPTVGAGTLGLLSNSLQGPLLAIGWLTPGWKEWPNKRSGTGGAVAFEPGGRRLVWTRDGRIIFWDLSTGTALRAYPGNYTRLVFSPNSKQLAGQSASGIKLWEAETGRELASLQGNSRGVTSMAFSPDGKRIAASIFMEGVKVWDALKGEELFAIHPEETISQIAFSGDDQRLVGVGQYQIHVWDATTDPGLQATFAGNGPIAFSPHDSRLASADTNVHLWDVVGRREEHKFSAPGGGPFSAPLPVLAFSPDDGRLAVAYRDGSVDMWDLSANRRIHQFLMPSKNNALPGTLKTRTLCFSGDGRFLHWAWRGPSGECEVGAWNAETGAEEWHNSLPLDTREAGCAAISPDARWLATSGADPLFHMKVVNSDGSPLPAKALGPVQIWSSQEGKLLLNTDSPADFLIFSPDGRFLVGGQHADNSVIVWDTQTGQRVQRLGGYKTSFYDAAFTPDRRRLAAINADGVHVWNLETGNEVLSLKGITNVQFSSDGRFLAATVTDGHIKVWNVGPVN